MPADDINKIWTGTIGFGLVSIPVGITTALRPSEVHFRMLHEKDGSPLGRKMFCPEDESFVDRDQIIKGYEVSPGKYVTLEEDEIRSVKPEESSMIEIDSFADRDSLRDILIDKPYYLVPTDTPKPYNLLSRVMEETGRIGITRLVMRDMEHLAVLISMEGVLCLITLHFMSDMVDPGDAGFEEKPEADKEMVKMIKKKTVKFHPEKYKNPDLENIKRMLSEKEGEIESPPRTKKKEPVEIMEALEESLEEKKSGNNEGKGGG
jgi:DNA end-binding protein Ku